MIVFSVKEFLETAKEQFKQRWENPIAVSFIFKKFLIFNLIFFKLKVFGNLSIKV